MENSWKTHRKLDTGNFFYDVIIVVGGNAVMSDE